MKKLLLMCSLLWTSNCLAVVSNVVISTDLNTIRIIDLSSSITEIYTDIVIGNEQAGELPTQGTAVISGTQISYTPQNGFIGFETFRYSVFNSGVFVASATISIRVGNANVTVNPINTPSEAISDTLSLVCFSQNGSPASTELTDLCSDFLNVNPTLGELDTLLEELAPKEIDAQNNLSTTIAANQIDNIRKRLAALRQGARGFEATRVSLTIDKKKSINVSSLFKNNTKIQFPDDNIDAINIQGGGASSEQTNRSPWGFFIGGNVGAGLHDETDNIDGYEFSTQGTNVGLDYRLSRNAIAGAAFGFNSSDMQIDNNKGDLLVSGGSFIGYGTYYLSQSFYIESILARYQNDFESNRTIDYTIQNTQKTLIAHGETINGVLSFSLGLGYESHYQQGISFTISANADYIKSTFDGYAESGAGGANLLIRKREQDLVVSTIDMQVTYSISLRSGVFIPQLGIAWKHDYNDEPTKIEAVFFGDPSNTPITFSGDSPETDYFKVNLGFSWIFIGGNTAFANIDTTVGQKDLTAYNLSLGMRLEF